MFDTAFTFGLTQFARSLSFPERLQNRPFRNTALEPLRWRNAGLDALFYDIKALTAEETFYISDSLAAEGLIMIVPPAGQGMLTICESVDEYVLRGGRQVRALTIAGIGGSAIGAAAFARNVANAVGGPVAAVVSGYGLGDVMTEAMGGLFFFGPLGFLRGSFEMIDDMVGRPQFGVKRQQAAKARPARSCLESDTVAALLAHGELGFDVIATHSKGSRTLSEAIGSLVADKGAESLKRLENSLFVTFGARISLPPPLDPAIAVMGELDWYGEVNSGLGAGDRARIALCGHSTNTDMPCSLRVTELLQPLLAGRAKAETPKVQDVPLPKAPAIAVVEKAADLIEASSVATAETVQPPLMPQPEPEAPMAEMQTAPLAASPVEAELSAEASLVPVEEPVAPPAALPQTDNAIKRLLKPKGSGARPGRRR
ncbi:hypothetical protein [Allorhizobium undicola]|uniref:hypothetical protein n=1 Tax=Allorhizobium undicola TaxID=78527 RepID=UPI000684EA3F|nr:hypothetical protein [Allorhizobium undicola]